MIGQIYIDGIDIYATFGIFINEGGYDGVVTFPPLKKPESNDWQEEDGEDVDLSAPTLDSREFSITFFAHKNHNVKGLIDLLSNGAYHEFNLTEIGQTFTLRMLAQPARQLFIGAESFTLTFADDFPLKNYAYVAPTPTTVTQTGYTLDAKQLSSYGIWVVQGTEAEMRKTPAVKKNLQRDIANAEGTFYDGEAVTFQAKQVTMQLTMVAPTLATFWKNYKAFLFDLTKAGAHQIYTESTGDTYPCYYSNASVRQFSPIGSKVWCSFSVTLVYTTYRNPEDYFVLATQQANPIITQKGDFLNMEYPGHYAVDGDKVKVTELPEATEITGLVVLGVDASNKSVQIPAKKFSSANLTPGTYGSPTKNVVLTVGPSGSLETIAETEDESGGSNIVSLTTETMTGIVNGVNKIFSTSVPFEAGMLSVSINGLKDRGFTALSDRQIEFTTAPKSAGFTDLVEAIFVKKQVPKISNTLIDELLIGAINNLNKTFTTSVAFAFGTISVYVNGLKENFTWLSDRQIALSQAPKNTGIIDRVEAFYIKK